MDRNDIVNLATLAGGAYVTYHYHERLGGWLLPGLAGLGVVGAVGLGRTVIEHFMAGESLSLGGIVGCALNLGNLPSAPRRGWGRGQGQGQGRPQALGSCSVCGLI